ncbi:MAG: GAF domain-containing protein [Rhodoferax sp.]
MAPCFYRGTVCAVSDAQGARRNRPFAAKPGAQALHFVGCPWQSAVQHMHTRWPFLGASPNHTSHSSHTELDNTAILLASQSLSSETSLPRLVAILIEMVSKITGASGSAFLLSDDTGQWFLEGGAIGTQHLLRQKASAREGTSFSGAVIRLGLKIGKPVVSDDAVQDKRLARDAYFSGSVNVLGAGVPGAGAGP